jgi:hypothetical protein
MCSVVEVQSGFVVVLYDGVGVGNDGVAGRGRRRSGWEGCR